MVGINTGYKPCYYSSERIWIYNTDFIIQNEIKLGTVDLIVTSPPYNVDISYGSIDDNCSYNDYLRFTRDWLTTAYHLSKISGRMCLNIPLDKNKGGQQAVCADITTIAKAVGWELSFHYYLE